MPEYAQLLGIAVRTARKKMKLTQVEVANSIDIECRTVVSMHSNNVPQNITDGLRMCSKEDVELLSKIVQHLVDRNCKNWNDKNYTT